MTIDIDELERINTSRASLGEWSALTGDEEIIANDGNADERVAGLGQPMRPLDVRAVVSAVNAIPGLIAEVRRLRAKIASQDESISRFTARIDHAMDAVTPRGLRPAASTPIDRLERASARVAEGMGMWR